MAADEFSDKTVDDLTAKLKVDQEIEVRVLNLDRKTRFINVSVKAIKDPNFSMKEPEQPEAASEPKRARRKKAAATTVAGSEPSKKATLGDIFKEQLTGNNQESEPNQDVSSEKQ